MSLPLSSLRPGCFYRCHVFAKLAGLFPYEAGVTAGICCCNIGGSGNLAVLTALDRYEPSGICLYLYTNWRCFDGRMRDFCTTVNEIACWKPLKLIADNSLLKYYIVTTNRDPSVPVRVQFGALYFIRWFVYEICKTYCDLSGRIVFSLPWELHFPSIPIWAYLRSIHCPMW